MLALLTVPKATVVYLKNQYMILKTVYLPILHGALIFCTITRSNIF